MPNESDNLEIIRLGHSDKVLYFDCGDEDLNEFFLKDSLAYTKELLSVTYVYVKEDKTVLFFSVSNDKISLQDVPDKNFWNRFRKQKHFPNRKRLPSYPAVKLGRLGVHKDFQSQKYGQKILDFIKIFFVENNKTGCRFITVDAYNKESVIKFYKANGFDFLTNDEKSNTRLMIFDLASIAQANQTLQDENN